MNSLMTYNNFQYYCNNLLNISVFDHSFVDASCLISPIGCDENESNKWPHGPMVRTLQCVFVCVFRSGGACTEHRDGLSGLVFPSERPERQQHPALSVHIQTIQPEWSVSLSVFYSPDLLSSLQRDLISILNIVTAHTHICFSLTVETFH